MSEREVILEGKSITKRFGGLVAVSNVSFQLYKGEILGLIGSNGAGKTTLFNMISGTLPMTEGELYYHGSRIDKPVAHSMCEQGIGRTYQICQPFGDLTVLDNVMVGAYLRYKHTEDSRNKAREILDFVGLSQRSTVNGNNLTLPEMKRLELARALATEPDVLLMDEVIAGLNPTEVGEIIELVRKIHDSGISIIMIEHVMQAIMSLSDRIFVMDQGEKIAEGLPEEVSKNQRVIESYLGKSKSTAQNTDEQGGDGSGDA